MEWRSGQLRQNELMVGCVRGCARCRGRAPCVSGPSCHQVAPLQPSRRKRQFCTQSRTVGCPRHCMGRAPLPARDISQLRSNSAAAKKDPGHQGSFARSAAKDSWVCPAPDREKDAGSSDGQFHGTQVALCHVEQLQAVTSLAEAVKVLKKGVEGTVESAGVYRSGVLRLEVPLPRGINPLWWLRSQVQLSKESPSVYFAPRRNSAQLTEGRRMAEACSEGQGSVAGLGAAWLWKGRPGGEFAPSIMQGINRFLSKSHSQIRVLGGTRFNPRQVSSPEWAHFGSYFFLLPCLEVVEGPQGMCLACNLAWDAGIDCPDSSVWGCGPCDLKTAVSRAQALLQDVTVPSTHAARAPRVVRELTGSHPEKPGWLKLMNIALGKLVPVSFGDSLSENVEPDVARQEFLSGGQESLDDLLAALSFSLSQESMDPSTLEKLTKVVLARRTDLQLTGHLNSLELLGALQDADPQAYQLALCIPDGGSFISSTPERLYARTGDKIASEAVAGTRARGPKGDVEKDFWLGFDMLQSHKDHVEFTLVRDWLQDALSRVCMSVVVDIPKTVMKHGAVQHLYSLLSGTLASETTDADLLNALHPTPAIAGRPRDIAQEFLQLYEDFDRGFYAGPFGWISGAGAEFVVAIRSALIVEGFLGSQAPSVPGQQQSVNFAEGIVPEDDTTLERHAVQLYAGVGVVKESDPQMEWEELDLKVKQFERLLVPRPGPLDQMNMNMVWTSMIVEELCRMGLNTVGIAPGSRSSPLTAALAMHPRVRVVPCIDERSLGFWALGFAQATGRPAPVVTTSGTAVANLLPAVVEASMSHVPMLLLTADRPPELRDTGANQCIDQVKIFGSYVRWAQDLPPPDSKTPGRMLLTALDTAVRIATNRHNAGPVHLNLQFREPLAPTPAASAVAIDDSMLQHWQKSLKPFTAMDVPVDDQAQNLQAAGAVGEVVQIVKNATRGLLVVGHLCTPRETHAAAHLASVLQWPTIADVLSGLKVGNHGNGFQDLSVYYADNILIAEEAWAALAPDVVLQVGGHLTSKRLHKFLSWSTLTGREDGSRLPWISIIQHPGRDDPAHLLSHSLQVDLSSFCSHLPPCGTSQSSYLQLWQSVDQAVSYAVGTAMVELQQGTVVCEPSVAWEVAQSLPSGQGLFLGNSMPIRDMEMFAGECCRHGKQFDVGVPVAANRGASGIDGVLSSAAGFAVGLQRPVTLVIGDVSFLHDINGLNLLRSGEDWPVLTVVLINNSGGGIFNFLPIADAVSQEDFTALWTTPQHVALEGMCRSHGIPHQKVCHPDELSHALKTAWCLKRHSVVEIVTDRNTNLDIHRHMQSMAQQAVNSVVTLPGAHSNMPQYLQDTVSSRSGSYLLKLQDISWQNYCLETKSGITSCAEQQSREGLLVTIELVELPGVKKWYGIGEIAPLPGLNAESLQEAESQLRLMAQILKGKQVPSSVGLVPGQLHRWLATELGGDIESLASSVRFGIETAILHALAASMGSETFMLAHLLAHPLDEHIDYSVSLNALVDPRGDSNKAVELSREYFSQGFSSLKVKVAREGSPETDAEIVKAIRAAAGKDVKIRADANQGWDLDEAVRFGIAVHDAHLEYVEEPTVHAEDLCEFFKRTGVRFALDETVDEQVRSGRSIRFRKEDGLAALVVKPTVLGSVDAIMEIGRWGRANQVDVVVSSSFESSVGLSTLCQVAVATDAIRKNSQDRLGHQDPVLSYAPAHGLATTTWFANSVVAHHSVEIQELGDSLKEQNILKSARMGLEDTWKIMQAAAKGNNLDSTTVSMPTTITTRESLVPVQGEVEYIFRVLEMLPSHAPLPLPAEGDDDAHSAWPVTTPSNPPIVVFLHGFLGSSDDWVPQMASLSKSCWCISVDLPGHGETQVFEGNKASTVERSAGGNGRVHRVHGQNVDYVPAAFRSEGSEADSEDKAPQSKSQEVAAGTGGMATNDGFIGDGVQSAAQCASYEGYSLENVSSAIVTLLETLGISQCTLVGYSLGARVALTVASQLDAGSILRCEGVACISGTAGIPDPEHRLMRARRDDDLAFALRSGGLEAFLGMWYKGPLWQGLRQQPQTLERLLAHKARIGNAENLSHALSGLSTGRMVPLHGWLSTCSLRLLFVAGQEDVKFVHVGKQMAAEASKRATSDVTTGGENNRGPETHDSLLQSSDTARRVRFVEIEGAWHAVHIEKPLALSKLLHDFIVG